MKGEGMITEVPTDPIEIAKLRVLEKDELLSLIPELKDARYEDYDDHPKIHHLWDKYKILFQGKIGTVHIRKYVLRQEVLRGTFKDTVEAEARAAADMKRIIEASIAQIRNTYSSPEAKEKRKLQKEIIRLENLGRIKRGYTYGIEE